MTSEETRRFMSVSAGGFSAHADAMLYDRDQAQVWFISMLGALTSTRAISASILKNPPDSLHALPDRDEDSELANREYFRLQIPWFTMGTWTSKVARLNVSGGWQCMVYTKLAEYGGEIAERSDFLLTSFTGDKKELIRNHYRFLDRRTELPIHESWAEWLWKRGLEGDEIRPLAGHNMTGYYCVFSAEQLREDICVAVKRGYIRIEKEAEYALGRTG